ncbi:MAG: sarcosine oxidase subunit delta [Paracoccaceae bacterium]|nr:sarcosine oxidase subunit delta [Paracoccaceae bacterium]
MKLLTCPMNGPRNISEFQYLGPVRLSPNPEAASDADWAGYLFGAPNDRDFQREFWRHTPSNYVFVAERHIGTGEVRRTYDPGEME